MKYISMAFLTLIILKRVIGLLTVFGMIILTRDEMNQYVFDPMESFGIKKIKGVIGSRQMAVHTVCDESLFVIGVSGCLPGVVGKLDLMTA